MSDAPKLTWKHKRTIRYYAVNAFRAALGGPPRRGLPASYQDLCNPIRIAPADPLPEPKRVRPESVAAVQASRIPTVSIAVALTDAVNHCSFHGSVIHVRCGDSHLATRALALAVRVGWITRGNFDPTLAQRCVGVQGDRKLAVEHRDPLAHHYLTATYQWLEVDHVQQMLIGGGVL